MKRTPWLLPAIFAAAFFSTTRADAFCRTTTVNPTPEQEGCTTGTPLYHPKAGLTYRIVESDGVIPAATLAEKMRAAVRTWTTKNEKCTPGITIEVGEPVPKGTPIATYTKGERNQNFIGVANTWNDKATELLAKPTLTFSADSGAIFDADVEINGTFQWSFTEEPPPDGYDLHSVLVHEVGHLLGFGHSEDPESVMYPTYNPGEIRQRTLGKDDIEAVCTVYPSSDQRLTGKGLLPTSTCESPSADPANGCAEPAATTDDGGCSSTGRRTGGAGLALVAVAAVVTALRRRGAIARERTASRSSR